MNHYPRIKGYQDVPANRPRKESERAAISSQVEEYLRSGGVISSVEHGATGDGFKAKNMRIAFGDKRVNEDGTAKYPQKIIKNYPELWAE